ncbi:MAG TPA: hypothetical protein VIY29_24690 [Ktedonobacteraceae bacterium]
MSETIKQGMIESASDISKLGIVDWNRLNGCWENDVTTAIAILNTWVAGHARYTIAHVDLTQFAERDDWPGGVMGVPVAIGQKPTLSLEDRGLT